MGDTRIKSTPQGDTEIADKVEVPRRYKVIFHNDNFTPMEFVMELLMVVFDHDVGTAEDLMMKVHKQGRAIVGVYPKAVAKAKLDKTHEIIKHHDEPLKCTMEVE